MAAFLGSPALPRGPAPAAVSAAPGFQLQRPAAPGPERGPSAWAPVLALAGAFVALLSKRRLRAEPAPPQREGEAGFAFAGATRRPRAPARGDVAMGILRPRKMWRTRTRKPLQKFRWNPVEHTATGKLLNKPGGLKLKEDDQPFFGRFGLQIVEEGWITNRQLEILRRVLITAMDRRGKIYIRAFPHQIYSERIAESRLGVSGGRFEYWVAAIKKNYIMMELDGVTEEVAYKAMREASRELPIKFRMVDREHLPEEFELNYEPPRWRKYESGVSWKGKNALLPSGGKHKPEQRGYEEIQGPEVARTEGMRLMHKDEKIYAPERRGKPF